MSRKSKSNLDKRRDYVKKTVKRRSKERVSKVVKDLSNELFLGERTIYKDLSN